MKRFLRTSNKGFTIFFATLVASLALAIGIAVYDITVRQLDLSTTVVQSQYAIYAADSGAECALYWDAKYGGGGSAFAGSNSTNNAKIIYLTSGSSWTVPADWNSSDNSIEVIGGGGGGGAWSGGLGGGGGGGGAYAKVTNASLTPGATVAYKVGAGGVANGNNGTNGGDTYFCNSSLNCASLAGTAVLAGAKGGTGATGITGGSGGAGSSGAGGTRYSGGTGGNASQAPDGNGGGGGGGGGGPNGAGAHGGSSIGGAGSPGAGGGAGDSGGAGGNASGSTGGYGGNNSSGTGGGAGGSSGSAGTAGSAGGGGGGAGFVSLGNRINGVSGGSGTEWDSTHGSGGGGGGATANCANPGGTGGPGGNYGGGGGGGGASCNPSIGPGGPGASGIIVIHYAATTSNIPTSGIVCGSYDIAAAGTPPSPFAPQPSGWTPWNIVSSASAATTTFTLTFPGYSYCATVQVAKVTQPDGTVSTTVYSHGFNTCAANAQNQLERELKVSY